MPAVNKSLVVPYSAEQMYELINGIESYPEFLPWCTATEIHSRNATALKATLHLAKGPLSHSITTINTMQPNQHIAMEYIAGPFRTCTGAWRFVPINDTKNCQVIFTMEYQFINKLSAIAIEPIFNPITNTLIDGFYARARQIYGS